MIDRKRVIVKKCSGGFEEFSRAKLRRPIRAAMRRCNRDEHLADALAEAVEIHLQSQDGPEHSTTHYVFRCVCAVLRQTSLGDVAEEMRLHRRRRSAARERVVVLDTNRADAKPMRWRKSAVADRLVTRHGVGHAVARILAGEVEKRVLALDYSVVSKSLVEELNRSELAAWGMTGAIYTPAAESTRSG